VNNAKYNALREPFIFSDNEYFKDALRYPRLYIPFFGWLNFLGATTGFLLAVAIGFLFEAAPTSRFDWPGQLGGIVTVFLAGMFLLFAGNWRPLAVSFDPKIDMRAIGFLASLWRYGQEERVLPTIASPFHFLSSRDTPGRLPHLIAVQSESFFDPRSLYAGIRSDVLIEFDRLRAESFANGKLKVPAWGANTVRTEFAFLTGVEEGKLGVHRFNPYRTIAYVVAVLFEISRLSHGCHSPLPRQFLPT
jgi:hypothetical protein